MKRVNKIIKKAVDDCDLSYNKIGHKLGYTSGQFIYNWRKGISTPPLDRVKRLCSLLNINLNDYKEALLKDYKDTINDEI